MSVELVWNEYNDTMKRGGLAIWTVCQNPRDHPGKWTARLTRVMRGGIEVTDTMFVARNPTQFRTWFANAGLTRLPRQDGDEPQIREIWL